MAIITVRVSDELKKHMRRFKKVNWSSVIRKAIEDRIMVEQSKEKKDKALILEANEAIESVFAQSNKKYGTIEYDSAVTIRRWRDLRSKHM
jgi:predicted transcriptional regulator